MKRKTLVGICVVFVAILAFCWNVRRHDSKLSEFVSREKITNSQQKNGDQNWHGVNHKPGVVDRVNNVTGALLSSSEVSEKSQIFFSEKEQKTGATDPLKNDARHATEAAEEVMGNRVEESVEKQEAIRLSDDFALPSAMMHLAAIEAGHEAHTEMSPQIRAAVSHLVDDFYRDVNKVARGDSEVSPEEEVVIEKNDSSKNETSEEMVRVIEPSKFTQEASDKANSSHQLLFGDEAANRYGIQSLLEVRLPVKEESGEVYRNQ